MSMADRDGWIWYDGKMVPWRDATTHVLTHTLHYGMTLSNRQYLIQRNWVNASGGYCATKYP